MARSTQSWQNCRRMSRARRRIGGSLGRAKIAWLAGLVLATAISLPGVTALVASKGTNPQDSSKPQGKRAEDGHSTGLQTTRGLEIVQHGGYPELRVDGTPFFIHSAAFFYDRTPRDLWEPMLDRYRSLGINTLDLYIPWNWHEPKEGELDFDGHSNPRRDLRSLLSLATQKGFRIIARPGPEILNEWRHGGYPGWLLERPEYKMNPLDWVEGRYPPLDNLNARDAEAAARGWLDNYNHMEATKSWFAAVAKELAPYSSQTIVRLKPENRDDPPREVSGPLLFVQLGDDFAIGRTNHVGPDFWRYVQELREMLVAGGLSVPVFINPMDMRVSASGAAQSPEVGVMGQWYMHPREGSAPDVSPQTPQLLSTEDAADIEFLSEELKMQPHFPPAMIEYQAGWYAPADDDRPKPNLPDNTLLSSRLLIANGIHGFNYFPLQDTVTPAGYSVPWANPSYRWDAALGPGGDPQPRLEAVRRNSQLLQVWGSVLAASHKRADFGIIYPLGAFPEDSVTAQDIHTVSDAVKRIERLGTLGLFSSELLDPEYQPVEELLRDPLLFLPVFDPEKAQFQLSERAQSILVEYVRRGGTIVVFPERPRGKIIEELWRSSPGSSTARSETAIRARWKFAEGEVIESSKDFYSWLSLDRSLGENRARQESTWALRVLDEFVGAAKINPAVKFSGKSQGSDGLILSELISNEGTELLGKRTGGQGFLSATNVGEHDTADLEISVLSPLASAKSPDGSYSLINLIVPPRESLLLPLELPLCFTDRRNGPCGDSIPIAGAEFLNAERNGKTLELTFYIPARADIRVRLEDKPNRVALDEMDTRTDSVWTPETKQLQLTIPRGAAPDFRRTLKLGVRHTPHVPEPNKHNQSGKAPPEDLEYYVQNAVRFPTGGNAFLRTYPALIVPGDDGKINLLLIAENRNSSASGYLDFSFDKPLHGSKNLVVPPNGTASELIEFRPSEVQPTSDPKGDHLFRAAIEVRASHDRRVLPITALLHRFGTTDRYRFDFDRDGADEWVLENDRLRLIVSPESGGRAVALLDKSSGASLASSVGLLRDNFSFIPNVQGTSPARARGKYGLFNRSYAASWAGDEKNPQLHLAYEAADIFPGGATIEKTVQFDGPDALRAEYKVALRVAAAAGVDSTNVPTAQAQSFAVVNSFPLDPDSRKGANAARICWQKNARQAVANNTGSEDGGEDCVNFEPDGEPFTVPDGIAKIVIHSPGRAGIELSWDCMDNGCAQMTVEPKIFSALFRLEFAPLVPGADASHYSMRIQTLDLP